MQTQKLSLSTGILFPLTVVLGGLIGLLIGYDREATSLKAQIEGANNSTQSALREVETLKRASEQKQEENEKVSPCPPTPCPVTSCPVCTVCPEVTPEVKGDPVSPLSVPTPHREPAFRITSELAAVEQFVALTEAERVALKNFLKAQPSGEVEAQQSSFIEALLGPERYQRYLDERFEYRKKLRAEVEERELFSLTRKLNLSSEQQTEVEKILNESRELFTPLSRIEPSPSEQDVAGLRRRLESESQRQEYVAEKLKPLISEAQYNYYLQDQASAASAQSHGAFLGAASDPS